MATPVVVVIDGLYHENSSPGELTDLFATSDFVDLTRRQQSLEGLASGDSLLWRKP